MQDRTLTTKEEVLGEAVPAKGKGGFQVTSELSRKPLRYEGAVVRCFCLSCGQATELHQEGANKLAQKAGVVPPVSWEGHYFEAQHCIVCDSDYKEVALKSMGQQ